MKIHKSPYFIFFLTILFLFTLQFVFDIKSFILITLLYGALVFFLTKLDLAQTLFILLIVTLPFEKGLRGWQIIAVPPGPENWIQGYQFYFGLTLKYIFTSALVLLTFIQNKKLPIPKTPYLLLIFFTCITIISTVFSSNFSLAIPGLIRIIYLTSLFILGTTFLNQKTIKKEFPLLLLAILLFFGYIGTRQFFAQHPLGFFLEDSLAFQSIGYLTTDGSPLYRVSGLIGHPTFFASFLSLLFPIGLAYIARSKPQHSLPTKLLYSTAILASLFSLIAIFGTFSRSAWIAVAVTFIFFIWKIINKHPTNYFKRTLPVIFPLLLVSALFSPLLITRIKSFNQVWSLGSGRVRLDLIKQSWLMIKSFPILGVSPNHFTRVMNMQDLPPELKGFMYPVHNTFLLFFSELGIPAGIIFIIFILLILKRSFTKSKKNWIDFGIWIGAFTFLINAQFHTLFSQDPSLDMFILLLAYLSLL